MTDKTITFSIRDEYDMEMKKILAQVYRALEEKVIIPSVSLSVICFRRPTYITTHNNARNLIRRLDRTKSFRL